MGVGRAELGARRQTDISSWCKGRWWTNFGRDLRRMNQVSLAGWTLVHPFAEGHCYHQPFFLQSGSLWLHYFLSGFYSTSVFFFRSQLDLTFSHRALHICSYSSYPFPQFCIIKDLGTLMVKHIHSFDLSGDAGKWRGWKARGRNSPELASFASIT